MQDFIPKLEIREILHSSYFYELHCSISRAVFETIEIRVLIILFIRVSEYFSLIFILISEKERRFLVLILCCSAYLIS